MIISRTVSIASSLVVGTGLAALGLDSATDHTPSAGTVTTALRTMTPHTESHAGASFAAMRGAAVTPFAPQGPGIPVILGADTNGANNPFIQPLNPALSGGGIDQTQQFFDLLFGDAWRPSITIGRLGGDFVIGGPYIDLVIGGPEHFNPNNRDKVFGLTGDDIFVWAPGDGSDRFDGGPGADTVIFGLIGEVVNGQTVFRVSTDQQAGQVHFDPVTGLPVIDVTNSPGFCEVIDRTTSANAAQELALIDADRLAQFILRSVRQSFNAGTQTTDNGVRVTLTLKEVEYVVCTDPNGGAIVAYDITQQPPVLVPLWRVPQVAQWIVR